jgi:hypothetical protein
MAPSQLLRSGISILVAVMHATEREEALEDGVWVSKGEFWELGCEAIARTMERG